MSLVNSGGAAAPHWCPPLPWTVEKLRTGKGTTMSLVNSGGAAAPHWCPPLPWTVEKLRTGKGHQ